MNMAEHLYRFGWRMLALGIAVMMAVGMAGSINPWAAVALAFPVGLASVYMVERWARAYAARHQLDREVSDR